MISIKRYTWLLHVGTMAVCAYFVAQAISTYVASLLEGGGVPAEETRVSPLALTKREKPSLEDYQIIADRNIFNSSQTVAEGVAEGEEISLEEIGEMGPAVKTGLDITLAGTLVIGEGTDRRSSALVSSGKAKGAKVYFVADEESFAPNVRLMKVQMGRIEFLNGNRLEYAEIEDQSKVKSIFATRDEVFGPGGEEEKGKKEEKKEKAAPESAGERVVLEQREIDEALSNVDRLYSDVRIVPNFQEGKSKGLKLLSVKPGSIIAKLGVRRGDVLEKINGEELDIKRGMELFSQLKDMKNFSLDIVRGGANKTIEYEIR